ncbi:CaiB/BaiF CoA transferase family protein [Chloroflexota bacterium]
MNNDEVFKEVKVADFTWVVVGPLTTRYLAAHGATVVRVESTQRPDVCRTSRPFKDKEAGLDKSGYYAFYNANKYSLALNLNNPHGKQVVRRLIAWADIITENFAPGMMERWGLGYEELKKIKPDIIMLRTSNQGQTGPQAKQPGLGPHLVGLSGLSYYTGWPDREPIGFGMAYTDMIAPRFAISALIAALDYRRRTGKGQLIDISQLETALHFLSPQILDYTTNGRIGNRAGNRCALAAPHGAVPCRGEDSWCAIAIFNDEQWGSLCRLIDKPWTEDARFGTLRDRKQNEDELEALVAAWTINYDDRQLMEMLQAASLPAGVAQSNEDVFNNPQLKHRNSFWQLEHSAIGPYTHLGQPFSLSRTPARAKMPSPCLGEHTEHVCTEFLGMSDEEFIELVSSGAFE